MTVLVARTGGFYIAPVATPFPTTPTGVLDPVWKHAGKLNSSGIQVGSDFESNTSNFWEDNEEFVISTGSTWTFAVEFNDWNEDTLALYFNPDGFDTTEGSITVTDSDAVTVAVFINFFSGSTVKAFCIPRFEVTGRDALSIISTDKLALPVTGTARKDEDLGGFFKILDPELIAAP